MNNTNHYYPILKWKAGEKNALAQLKHKSGCFTPIIELVVPCVAETFFEELVPLYNEPIFLDLTHYPGSSEKLLEEFISYAVGNNQEFIPVISYENLSLIPRLQDTKIAIKLTVPEANNVMSNEALLAFLSQMYPNNQFIIILDGGLVLNQSTANSSYNSFKKLLSTPYLASASFDQVIVTLTSFPEQLNIPPAGENHYFERYDINIYRYLLRHFKENSVFHKLSYADYGVTKFTDSELDFSKMKNGILPKIKYTTFDSYIVLKGKKSVRTYTDMSKEIIESDYYFGKDFSFGDLDIYKRGTKQSGPGNNTQWVTINANHHISVVLEQLSNLDAFLKCTYILLYNIRFNIFFNHFA